VYNTKKMNKIKIRRGQDIYSEIMCENGGIFMKVQYIANFTTESFTVHTRFFLS